jgi:hypothetical protein
MVRYWLGPQARGRAVASIAVRLLAQWEVATMGLPRIELTCAPTPNPRAGRGTLWLVREGVTGPTWLSGAPAGTPFCSV